MAARAFPLDRDAFFAKVPVWEQIFELSEHVEVSGLADGSILSDAVGPRLWRGKCSIDLMPAASAHEVEALISLLQGPARSFLVWRLDRAFPKLDPDGTALSGSTPIITELPTDARELRIGGLPVGYTISPGDMLSFTYGSDPTRYALHRVVSEAKSADATGVTSRIEVVPPIRPGASVSAAVELIRPCCKAILVPGAVTAGALRRNQLRGVSFEFIQTLR